MFTYVDGLLKYKDASGQWHEADVIKGESAYQAAVRLGIFSGTESEYYNKITNDRDSALSQINTKLTEVLSAIDTKKQETLADIPSDYTTLSSDVSDLKSAVQPSDSYADVEIGSINSSSGANVNPGTDRLRTHGYVDQTINTVEYNSGYTAFVYAYDSDDVYIGGYTGTAFSKVSSQRKNMPSPLNMRAFDTFGYQYRLCWQKTGSASPSVNELDAHIVTDNIRILNSKMVNADAEIARKMDADAYKYGYAYNVNKASYWSAGFIKPEDGTDGKATSEDGRNYIRTTTFLPSTVDAVRSDANMLIYEYDASNDSFIRTIGTKSNPIKLYSNFDHTTKKYRISAKRDTVDQNVKEVYGKLNLLSYMLSGDADSPYYRYVDKSAKAPVGFYGLPESAEHTEGFSSTTQYSELVTALNTIVENSGGYLEKSTLGQDSGGYDILKITAKSTDYSVRGYNGNRPKIIIVAGQQGTERSNVFGLYYLLKALSESSNTNPLLQFIHNYVELIVIPVVSPWGFNNNKYYNANGVSINRNYDTPNWESGDPSDPDEYGGTEPFSEPESSIVRDLIAQNDDALIVIDSHTYGIYSVSQLQRMNWLSFSTYPTDKYYYKLFTAARLHILAWTNWVKEIYSTYAPGELAGFYTLSDSTKGNLEQYCVKGAQINGMCCEGFNGFYGASQTYTDDVFKANGELILNWILAILRIYLNE